MKGSSLSGGSRLTAAGGGEPGPLVGLPGDWGAPLPPLPAPEGPAIGLLPLGRLPLPLAPLPAGVSGVARPCSRASDTGASHRLGSGNTPAASMCAASRSYCVLYGASCAQKNGRRAAQYASLAHRPSRLDARLPFDMQMQESLIENVTAGGIVSTCGVSPGRVHVAACHLEEAVVANQQRSSVDAQVQDAVMAGADDHARRRRYELHPLAPRYAHLQDSQHQHLHGRHDPFIAMPQKGHALCAASVPKQAIHSALPA